MELFAAAGTALWLGILTSISPCPLASNLAAISYVSKGLGNRKRVILAGLLYTAGRMLTYAVLAALIAASMASLVGVSNSLQRYGNQFLGPVLIVAGMFLTELLRWSPGTGGVSERVQRGADNWGLWGAAVLGSVFALSFCPVSAALFFGSLIPLALSSGSSLAMPSLYGIGTGLPVLAFAVLVAFGVSAISSVFARVTRAELWARCGTGVVFIAVGVYYCLTYIFEIQLM
jgi:cytochrome c biogenesis protein CcdA